MVKKDPILSRHKRDSTHDCVIKNETIEILKSNTNQVSLILYFLIFFELFLPFFAINILTKIFGRHLLNLFYFSR